MLINESKLQEIIIKKNTKLELHLHDISTDLYTLKGRINTNSTQLEYTIKLLTNLTNQVITIEHLLGQLTSNLTNNQKESHKINQTIFPFVQNRLDRAEIFTEIITLFDSYFMTKYFKGDYELFIEIFDNQVFLYFNDISYSFVKHESFRLNITPLLEQITCFDVSKINNLDDFTFILNYLSTHVITDFLNCSISEYIQNNLI